MKGRPGGTLWLLRHECRLFWYETLAAGGPGTARRSNWHLLGAGLLAWLFMHLAVFALLRATGAATEVAEGFIVTVSALLLATWLFMLSSALKASVETLFDRGDMDLLLSSPLPTRSIFSVKLIGMTAGVALLYLFFLTPFAHVGLLLGHPRWLAVYPLLLTMAALASSSAMLLTLALVRLLGARRTRVVAQVIGALAGALLFLLSQVGTFLSQGDGGAAPSVLARVMSASAALEPDSVLLLPARAALGEARAVLVLSALGLLTMLLTITLTHEFFARGLQLAASGSRVTRRPRMVRYRFDRGLAAAVLVKEWRLIARDPHLISQVLLQLLYLIPLCFIVFRDGRFQLPALSAGMTMLCGSLASALAWIVLMAEDTPDLLATAPASSVAIRRAKLAAATVPVLALVAVPLLWLILQAPVTGLLLAVTVVGAVGAAALIVSWVGRPMPRGEFTTRNRKNVLGSLLEVCNQLAWGALALLLTYGATGSALNLALLAGIAAAAVFAFGVPLLAFLVRRRRRQTCAP